MALREEFETSGNWLFRWRSYLPLAMIAVLIVGLYEHEQYQIPEGSEIFDGILEALAPLICLTGLGIRILAIGYTPKGTSGRNTKSPFYGENSGRSTRTGQQNEVNPLADQVLFNY